MPLPAARGGSHEDLLHQALEESALLVLDVEHARTWLLTPAGHRAVGVVYQPWREDSNYVPTVMGARYDALLWLEDTTALTPLHHEQVPHEREFETEPTGF